MCIPLVGGQQQRVIAAAHIHQVVQRQQVDLVTGGVWGRGRRGGGGEEGGDPEQLACRMQNGTSYQLVANCSNMRTAAAGHGHTHTHQTPTAVLAGA
jgi:hypothetical protein